MNNYKITCGIVLYNPEIERLKKVIKSVRDQVDGIILFDNSSDNILQIEGVIKEDIHTNIILLKSKKNIGIGGALNKISKKAREEAYDWLLTLDHDTICPQNIISVYKKYLNITKLGALCPNVVDKLVVKNYYNQTTGDAIAKVDICIQSGMLINLDAWKTSRGFDENLFIDFVDFDYCLRLKRKGYSIFKCKDVTIDHQLGAKEKTALYAFANKLSEITKIAAFKYLGYVNVWSKSRVYYTSRNNIIYIRRNKDMLNTRQEIFKLIKRTIKRLIRGEHKGMLIKATLHGTIDGFRFNINY